MRDHPREYGENKRPSRINPAREGPSPRIRGEYAVVVQSPVRVGTIPANTGRITLPRLLRALRWDHPREYGENVRQLISLLNQLGPSPRIRGEYGRPWQIHQRPGTIPANTGRIGLLNVTAACLRDHPREYGENGAQSLHARRLAGTIPANTGRMVWACCRLSLERDHPREYGENTARSAASPRFLGPSPRIRGECGGELLYVRSHRTIPANTGRI